MGGRVVELPQRQHAFADLLGNISIGVLAAGLAFLLQATLHHQGLRDALERPQTACDAPARDAYLARLALLNTARQGFREMVMRLLELPLIVKGPANVVMQAGAPLTGARV